jgi:hypothetical protein
MPCLPRHWPASFDPTSLSGTHARRRALALQYLTRKKRQSRSRGHADDADDADDAGHSIVLFLVFLSSQAAKL